MPATSANQCAGSLAFAVSALTNDSCDSLGMACLIHNKVTLVTLVTVLVKMMVLLE